MQSFPQSRWGVARGTASRYWSRSSTRARECPLIQRRQTWLESWGRPSRGACIVARTNGSTLPILFPAPPPPPHREGGRECLSRRAGTRQSGERHRAHFASYVSHALSITLIQCSLSPTTARPGGLRARTASTARFSRYCALFSSIVTSSIAGEDRKPRHSTSWHPCETSPTRCGPMLCIRTSRNTWLALWCRRTRSQ